MAVTKMHLQESPYRAIESGEKRFETRLFDEKRKQLEVGDEIEFVLRDEHGEPTDESLTRSILALHRYQTFADFYEDHPNELHQGDARDYYSEAAEAEYGVVAIELG